LRDVQEGLRQRGGLINNVQFLRAFAAIAVVFLHSTSGGGLILPISYGHFGVDIFFVISGFIISYIADADPTQFLRKRIIRIVPFYWSATICVFLIAHTFPALVRTAPTDLRTLISSLLFIPYDALNHTNPFMYGRQTLLLGWTLNYEMYFYAVLAMSLWISRRWASMISAVAILTIMAAVNAAGVKLLPGAFYGNYIVVEFVYGILIFQAFRYIPWIQKRADKLDAGFMACAILCAASFIFLLSRHQPDTGQGRFITAGLPAIVFVGCAIIFEKRYAIAVRNAWLLMLGEASYVLYLTHLYVISGALRLVFKGAQHWPPAAQWGLVLIFIGASIAAAIVIHIFFERPIISALRKRFLHRPPPAIFVSIQTPPSGFP